MAELKNTIVNGVLNVNGDLIASKITLRGDPGSLLRGNGSVIATGSNGQFLSISNGVPTWVSPTKSSVGLGNVDNTADANKSVNHAATATNLVSFVHTYHRPTASGGDGKQWMRILNFVDNDIANGSRWYGKAVDIEFYNNGYGSSGNYTYMGHVSLCIVVQNHGSFVNESVTIKWRDCKPDIWAPDHIKAVKNANSVEIFMLNDIWDTNIIGVIVRNQGLNVAASSTCYTREEFATYVNDKSVVTGIIDTNLAIGRLDNYTKKTITLSDNVDLNTITNSGFYRLRNHTKDLFPHSQMIVSRGEDTIAQIVFPWSYTKMFVRTGNNITSGSSGSWRDWKEVAFTDDIKNGTLNLGTSGTGISGSASFTANQSDGSTFTVTLDSSAAGNRGANKVVLAKAAGQIDSDKFTVTSAGTAKASFSYNSSTDCVELTWM